MDVSRRNLVLGGVGIMGMSYLTRSMGYLTRKTNERARAWRVSYVDCSDSIVDGYDGEQFYATLITDRGEARDRLRELDCFELHRKDYLSLDYDRFVVSIRTAVLPSNVSLRTNSYAFRGNTLFYRVETVDGTRDDSGERMTHVITTWELNDAEKPERIEMTVDGGAHEA